MTVFSSYRLFHSITGSTSYRLQRLSVKYESNNLIAKLSVKIHNVTIMGNPLFNVSTYRITRGPESVKMNGFNSKVVCKNSHTSAHIWEIPIIQYLQVTDNNGGFRKTANKVCPPWAYREGGLMKTLTGSSLTSVWRES